MRCPTCDKQFERAASTALPFCSDRCRQIDLGRWLNEEQRVPAKSLEVDDEPEERPHQLIDDEDDD
jgi:endogenous inhibitor of DNA gyrase (YacG/DUF329 family)